MGAKNRKGIGEINACFISQVVNIRTDIRCALHGCIVHDLVCRSLHVLIECHKGHHVDREDKDKSHDHDGDGNVDIGFAFLVEDFFHHPNIPPSEVIST